MSKLGRLFRNIVMKNLSENVRRLTHGNLGLRSIPKYTTLWWVFGILVASLYCLHRLMKSRHGTASRVISKDQELAGVMGIDTARTRCSPSLWAASSPASARFSGAIRF